MIRKHSSSKIIFSFIDVLWVARFPRTEQEGARGAIKRHKERLQRKLQKLGTSSQLGGRLREINNQILECIINDGSLTSYWILDVCLSISEMLECFQRDSALQFDVKLNQQLSQLCGLTSSWTRGNASNDARRTMTALELLLGLYHSSSLLRMKNSYLWRTSSMPFLLCLLSVLNIFDPEPLHYNWDGLTLSRYSG